MRIWRVVLLMNLALVVGLGVGYAAWGRRVASVEAALATAQSEAQRLDRERAACLAGGGPGEQLWEGRGIVRAVYPRLLIVTHEEIPGLLPARTTGFRLAESVDPAHVHAGDSIRFQLKGLGQGETALFRIEAW